MLFENSIYIAAKTHDIQFRYNYERMNNEWLIKMLKELTSVTRHKECYYYLVWTLSIPIPHCTTYIKIKISKGFEQ